MLYIKNDLVQAHRDGPVYMHICMALSAVYRYIYIQMYIYLHEHNSIDAPMHPKMSQEASSDHKRHR
jgi:hypothetical protein